MESLTDTGRFHLMSYTLMLFTISVPMKGVLYLISPPETLHDIHLCTIHTTIFNRTHISLHHPESHPPSRLSWKFTPDLKLAVQLFKPAFAPDHPHAEITGIRIIVFVVDFPYPDDQVPVPIQVGVLIAPPSVRTIFIISPVILLAFPFGGIRNTRPIKLIGPDQVACPLDLSDRFMLSETCC